jgi:hypothetical protein
MYTPPTFMTTTTLAEVLAEYEWPAPYVLEDWLPDGIAMVFPRCELMFVENFESDMTLRFSPDDTGLDERVTLAHLLVSMGGRPTPGLIHMVAGGASLDKMKNGVRDLCTIMLTHFRSTLLGDFAWVEGYKAYLAKRQPV